MGRWSEAFLDVSRTPIGLTIGEVEVPILYRDASLLQAFFWVDYDRAAGIVDLPGYSPVQTARGQALAGLGFFSYRDTSIGAYEEVALAVAVTASEHRPSRPLAIDLIRDPKRRRLGLHVLDLPVSAPIADAAGREIWGFPKFVTDLLIKSYRSGFTGGVLDPSGGTVLRLNGPRRKGVPLRSMDLVLLSKHDGDVLRTVVATRGWMWTTSGRGFSLEVGSSPHEMGTRAKELELDGVRPFLVQRSDRLLARLPKGSPD
jgi:hypothetical protein